MASTMSIREQGISAHRRHDHQQRQQHSSMWLWRSDYETWEMFSREEVAKIQEAHNAYSNGLVLVRGDDIYYLNLSKKTQTNTTTGRMRLLQHIERGSRWVYQTKPSSPSLATPGTDNHSSSSDRCGPWTTFTKHEAKRLEEALFSRDDGVILERGTDTVLYVDFQRWIMTDLATNTTQSIQLADTASTFMGADNNSSSEGSAVDASVIGSSKKETESGALLRSSLVTRPPPPTQASLSSSLRQEVLGKATTRSSWMRSSEDSEGTCSTLSTRDSESSILYEASDEDLAAPFMKRRRNQNATSNNSDALWLWRNNEGLWSTFEDQTAVAIERAYSKGETGVVIQREESSSSSLSSSNHDDDGTRTTYYIDLIDMTQTNLETNFVRNIERREDW